ncbi:hypothetical protein BDA96_09G233900 [Sorghum bicolor]|uniref:Uncharacterized protein n=1 Tax=Sorghum bicolor TaxID=4558 RepID=A0A921U5Z5_SORBI|nr:hypothetical protein BDA96_09G233900 [Sorghum bicolor]
MGLYIYLYPVDVCLAPTNGMSCSPSLQNTRSYPSSPISILKLPVTSSVAKWHMMYFYRVFPVLPKHQQNIYSNLLLACCMHIGPTSTTVY